MAAPPKEIAAEEITATYLAERFRFSNANGDVIVGDAHANSSINGPVTIKGPAEIDELKQHQTYRFYGRWIDYKNRRTGETEKQFHFQTFTLCIPHNREGIVAYLKSAGEGHYFGISRAKALWEAYGPDAVRVMRESPVEAAVELAKRKLPLSEAAAQAIAAKLVSQQALENCTIELTELLAGRGFRKSLPNMLLRKFGNRASGIVRRDPYKLLPFPGCGWSNCDQMYKDLGLPLGRLKRQALAAIFALKESNNGNTWSPRKVAEFGIRALVGAAELKIDRAIELALRAKLIVEIRTRGINGPIAEDGDCVWLADAQQAASEARLAEYVVAAMEEEATWPAVETIKNIDGEQPDVLRQALQGPIAILGGRPGAGKAQPLDANILTPSGYKKMRDIQVGDYVIGGDGSPTKVIGVYTQGAKEIYRVVMSDGSSTECCDEHLWATTTRNERKRKSHYITRPLSEIRKTLTRNDSGGPNHAIPMVGPIQFEKQSLPLNPYILGVLLGDGCFRGGSPAFSTPDSEIVAAIQKELPDDIALRKIRSRDCDYAIVKKRRGGPNAITQIAKNLDLWGKKSTEKHIPKAYLFASLNDRLSLLQGLLDTDAYTVGCGIEYSTSSSRLKEDIVFLVQSLGGTATVAEKIPQYTYKNEKRTGNLAYRIQVKLPSHISPFRLSYKRKLYKSPSKYPVTRRIVSVEHVGTKPAQCIQVEATDGLYVTDSCIVTHNTFTTANLIAALLDMYGEGSVAIGAPTNLAAQRLTQAMEEAGLKIRARTWHSLLGKPCPKTQPGEKWRFNAKNPFPFKVLIGDESSMPPTEIAEAIFAARAKGTLVLLVGDIRQLLPIDHGAPLRDLIAAKLPYGELKEIRRNSGGIVEACSAIADGKPWGEGDNLKIIQVDKPEEQQAAVLGLMHEMREAGLDPVWDSRVIVARNETRIEFNKALQAELNPNPTINGSPFRLADKIICRSNTDFPLVQADAANEDIEFNDEGNRVRVANGELGEVIEVAEKHLIVSVKSPLRVVRVPRAPVKETDTGTGCEWDLAYAVTYHSSQGSEFPWAIMVAGKGDRRMGCRELVYTGISRGKAQCRLVGLKSTFDAMCRRVALNERKTLLKERILLEQAKRELATL